MPYITRICGNPKGVLVDEAVPPLVVWVGPNRSLKTSRIVIPQLALLPYAGQWGPEGPDEGEEYLVEFSEGTDIRAVFRKLNPHKISIELGNRTLNGGIGEMQERIDRDLAPGICVGKKAQPVPWDLVAIQKMTDTDRLTFIQKIAGLGSEKLTYGDLTTRAVRGAGASGAYVLYDLTFQYIHGREMQDADHGLPNNQELEADAFLAWLTKALAEEYTATNARKKSAEAAGRTFVVGEAPPGTIAQSQSKLKALRARHKSIETMLAKIDATAEAEERRQKTLRSLEDRRDELKDQLQEYKDAAGAEVDESIVERLNAEVDALLARTREATERMEKASQSREAAKEAWTELNAQYKTMKDALDNLESGRCPILDIDCTSLEEHKGKLAEECRSMEGSLEELESGGKAARATLLKCQNETTELAAQLQAKQMEYQSAKADADTLKETIEDAKSKAPELRSRLMKVVTEIRDCKREAPEIGSASVGGLEKELMGVAASIRECEAEIRSHDRHGTRIEQAQENERTRREQSDRLEAVKDLQALFGPKGIQAELLGSGLSTIHDDVNAIVTRVDPDMEFAFRIVDKECRYGAFWRGEWKPFGKIPGSCQSVLAASLILAFVRRLDAPYKWLELDGMESIDARHRRQFLKKIVEMREAGELDQFFGTLVSCTRDVGIPSGIETRFLKRPPTEAQHVRKMQNDEQKTL